jgi:multidrug resistance efflux pump
MLNISPYKVIKAEKKLKQFDSYIEVEQKETKGTLIQIIRGIALLMFVLIFLPWTQNIQTTGFLTTYNPEIRPQNVNSFIPARIKKWYIKEGDLVKKGDTLVALLEVKDNYLDPNLLDRVHQQIKSKEQSVNSYMQKINALDEQIDALISAKKNKIEQLKIKLSQVKMQLQSDSIEYETQKINIAIAQAQLERIKNLYEKGLKSKTDYEKRNLTFQKALADLAAKENKYLKTKAEIANVKSEIKTTIAQYDDKIAKAESNKFATLSTLYDTEANISKLQNKYSSYSVRSGFLYITAPQTGYITKLSKAGIGETVKTGDLILTIVPEKFDFAAAVYVKPVDLPLLSVGQKVRLQFDGWPAIVFSGWPNISYGSYGGEIYAIDKFISSNGKFRVLIKPDTTDHPWPEKLSIGGGVKSIILLKDVPVWYELWRQINSFPPDYYISEKESQYKNENKK